MHPHINLLNKLLSIFRNFACDENHHESFSSRLTAVNEAHNHTVFIIDGFFLFLIPIFIQYNVGDVDITPTLKFSYPVNVQFFLSDLMLGLPYPFEFPYVV